MTEVVTSANPGLSQPLLAKRTSKRWMISALVTTAIVALPVLSVIVLALFPEENIWPHLLETTLPRYLVTTIKLMIGVGVITLAIGLATAWAVTMCEFPGRKFFEWALMLPFAVPAYVIAYVYTSLLDYAGPVQIALRDWFGWQSAADYWFPEIRSLGGATIMIGLVLYPYVYLLGRAAFLELCHQQVQLPQGGRQRLPGVAQHAQHQARGLRLAAITQHRAVQRQLHAGDGDRLDLLRGRGIDARAVLEFDELLRFCALFLGNVGGRRTGLFTGRGRQDHRHQQDHLPAARHSQFPVPCSPFSIHLPFIFSRASMSARITLGEVVMESRV